MVPTDQPEAAFNMLGHFIFDNREWREWLKLKLVSITLWELYINNI
jgi:hypothetical protein